MFEQGLPASNQLHCCTQLNPISGSNNTEIKGYALPFSKGKEKFLFLLQMTVK